MDILTDFDECLRDTPKFRSCIEQMEGNIDQLEQKLDKVLKNCTSMIDAGKMFVGQQSLFADSLWELSLHFGDDAGVMAYLNKLIHALQEMNNFQRILMDQASRTVVRDLNSFIKGDIKKAKESRPYFEKISNDLDIALNRNSQIPKNRPAEYEEASNILAATRSCFRHIALDYIHTLAMLQARRRHEILGSLLSYMQACFTYYHQGSDLAQDLDPSLKELSDDLIKMRGDSLKIEKEMENRYRLVTSRDLIPNSTSGNPKMEGYLFKRTTNAFKTWNRRWFCLKDHQLVYRKRTGEEDYTVMEDDLRLCSVKPVVDCDRRNCFEVVSPTKSHILQADSEEMYLAWVTATQQAIGAAIQREMGSTSINTPQEVARDSKGPIRPRSKPRSRVWEQLLKIPGNDTCCDCGSDNPEWASINLGITICIDCCGVHRSFGVYYSKVRGMKLDDWEPEILKVMAELGNTVVNDVYEAIPIPSSITRATPECPVNIREAWIKAKYVERQFVKPFLSPSQHTNREKKIFRTWSVRKLRRRPRSNYKFCTPNRNALSSSTSAKKMRDSTNYKYNLSPNEKNRKSERGSASSDENLNADMKNVSSLHGKILSKQPFQKLNEQESPDQTLSLSTDEKNLDVLQVDDNDNGSKATNEIHDSTENKDIGSEKSNEESYGSDVLCFDCDLPEPLNESRLELSSDQDSTAGEDAESTDEEDIENLHADMLLYKAAAVHNLPVMCKALAAGADKIWCNANDHGRSAIHQAIRSGSVMSCEYLILNGADINCQDADGKTALHLATELGHTAQVCLLLKHNANQHLCDKDHVKPLSIAVKKANADIVTLLRLGLLNELMKDSEVSGDETFNDVVRDFSQLACSNPERLQRRNEESNNQNIPE